MNIFDIDKKLRGFSLGELLIVVTLIIVLAISVLFTYRHQVDKAHDTTRKDHFKKFRIAFEDYYNDHNCYPTNKENDAVWENCTCGSACLAPYMDSFLCDPVTQQKYYYYPFTIDVDGVETEDTCLGYRLYTKLSVVADPDIINVGCSPTRGCGVLGNLPFNNYGISMGGPLVAEDFDPNTSSTPTPTTGVAPGCESSWGPWACNTNGDCNGGYTQENFQPGRCPVYFLSIDCCPAPCPTGYWCSR